MKALPAAIWIEVLKARRSRVPLITALASMLAPMTCGLFIIILEDPQRARTLGIVGTKAQLTVAYADWPTYFGLLAQAVAVGGLLLFAIVAAWIFGREFVDRTARTLLALPTPRWVVVVAKCVCVVAWCGLLAVWVLMLGFAIGVLAGLPGLVGHVVAEGVATFAGAAGMTIALQSTTALVASAGRGYLAPLGWAILTLFVAQILAATSWGAFFPWSVPALVSGIAGASAALLSPVSGSIVAATAVAGFGGLILWWQTSDQAA